METRQIEDTSRKRILVRLLYTVFFLIIFEIIKTTVQICVLFQYLYLFIAKSHSEPVKRFSNKAAAYAYRVLRYVTLNENMRPFPFDDFPAELDPPELETHFP